MGAWSTLVTPVGDASMMHWRPSWSSVSCWVSAPAPATGTPPAHGDTSVAPATVPAVSSRLSIARPFCGFGADRWGPARWRAAAPQIRSRRDRLSARAAGEEESAMAVVRVEPAGPPEGVDHAVEVRAVEVVVIDEAGLFEE